MKQVHEGKSLFQAILPINGGNRAIGPLLEVPGCEVSMDSNGWKGARPIAFGQEAIDCIYCGLRRSHLRHKRLISPQIVAEMRQPYALSGSDKARQEGDVRLAYLHTDGASLDITLHRKAPVSIAAHRFWSDVAAFRGETLQYVVFVD
jgi:hypothetical protein